MDKKEAKRQGRYTQFAMAATDLALKDAKLDTETVDKASTSTAMVAKRASTHEESESSSSRESYREPLTGLARDRHRRVVMNGHFLSAFPGVTSRAIARSAARDSSVFI